MIKSLGSIVSHAHTSIEMWAFYLKQKNRWISLPGLIIWSILPFLLTILGMALVFFILRVILT